MFIKIEGTTEILKDLQRIEELTEELRTILFRMPAKLELGLTSETETEDMITGSVPDNQ